MFLSSEALCSLGSLHQVSCCTFQRDKVEFTRFAHSLDQMLGSFRLIQHVLGQMRKSHACRSVSSCFFFLQTLTCSFSRGVLTDLVFALHPDSLIMSGACVKSGSMSRYCPFWFVPTRNTRFSNKRLFTSEPSKPKVPVSFIVYLDLRSLSICLSPICLSPSSSPCSDILTSSFEFYNTTALSSSESSRLSTNQIHVVKLPHVRRLLSSVHDLDQLVNFVLTMSLPIFCWKFHVE